MIVYIMKWVARRAQKASPGEAFIPLNNHIIKWIIKIFLNKNNSY